MQLSGINECLVATIEFSIIGFLTLFTEISRYDVVCFTTPRTEHGHRRIHRQAQPEPQTFCLDH
jgi:hypothetical protein